jgi:hypothetical protein
MDQLRLGVIDATVLTAPHCFVVEPDREVSKI